MWMPHASTQFPWLITSVLKVVTIGMRSGPSQRTGSRHFRCSFCTSIIPPSQRGLRPLESLLCVKCRTEEKASKRNTFLSEDALVVPSSSEKGSGSECESSPTAQISTSTADNGSTVQMLLDSATPKTKRMWGETVVSVVSKRKAVNPKRYSVPLESWSI